MQRSLGTFLLFSLILIPNLSTAQPGGGQTFRSAPPARIGSAVTIVSLLEQSHDLDKQVPLQFRMFLLRMQVEQVAELRPDLGRDWANELFLLASQEKGQQRATMQGFAMSILARLDPDRALELLHAMETGDAESSSGMMTPQLELARQVFPVLVKRDGEGALSVLEREAAFMGSAGRYPYSALGYAASDAVGKDWASNKQHAIQIEQSVLDLAVSRYSQTAPTYFDDLEFGHMLQVLAGGLPLDSVKPSLHLLVTNLLAVDTSKYQFHATVYTSDGKTAKADNAIDAAILSLGSLVNRDPDLVSQLESTRSQLQTALEYAKPGQMRSVSFTGMAGTRKLQLPSPSLEARSDALHLAHINAEAAIAQAEQMPTGPQRTSTLLELARRIAGDHPEQAANLIAEAKGGEQANDNETQLNVVLAEASVAAAEGNSSRLHDLLQQGFTLAGSLTPTEHKGFAAAPLVQLGIQYEPELTIGFLQNLPPAQLKAELLLNAAESLNLRSRLPFGPATQQKPVKAD
ncbi:MAG TPA: hypothetical protein VJQ54_16605 [Candidatus Sulfotelmatobacter sp.]|nr:hypothetical protein [Candidatus Sulfotelmatobacter sp.]